jgi:hypothetical protein
VQGVHELGFAHRAVVVGIYTIEQTPKLCVLKLVLLSFLSFSPSARSR